MVVIVSGFYPGQIHHFNNGFEIQESIKALCYLINETGLQNIIYEICNEYGLCHDHPLIGQAEGMAIELGIEAIITSTSNNPNVESNYYLQGVEGPQKTNGQRWLRLASLYPESIKYVEFFKNGTYIYTCYDEPFTLNHQNNWKQLGHDSNKGDIFQADIYLVNGLKIS